MSDQDTRERLEADVHQYANPGGYKNTLGASWEKKMLSFLDRQAAITRRETLLENPLHNNPYVGLVRGKQLERKQASDYHCGKCGYPVTDHDSYCPECGGALHKASNKPNSRFDVLKTAENAENVTSKSEIRNFDDSRERLEADIANCCYPHSIVLKTNYDEVRSWLDRQVAITEREVKIRELYKFEENHRANIDATEEVNRKLNERIAELTAERDELQAAIDAMENGQFYSMYKAKCEECERLKKVARTQAESFKKLECELAGKDG